MGMPGLETLIPIVYTHGVKAGRLTLEQMVAKCSTNPAKVMGLYPRKGVIAPGSDADLVLIDPDKTIEVDHATMETNADWSPYQGWKLAGFAEATYSRGRKIVDDYRFVGERGWGRHLTDRRDVATNACDQPLVMFGFLVLGSHAWGRSMRWPATMCWSPQADREAIAGRVFSPSSVNKYSQRGGLLE